MVIKSSLLLVNVSKYQPKMGARSRVVRRRLCVWQTKDWWRQKTVKPQKTVRGVCVCTHMWVCTCTCYHAYMCTHVYVHVHACVCMCNLWSVYACVSVHVHVPVCMHLWMHECVHVWICSLVLRMRELEPACMLWIPAEPPLLLCDLRELLIDPV